MQTMLFSQTVKLEKSIIVPFYENHIIRLSGSKLNFYFHFISEFS